MTEFILALLVFLLAHSIPARPAVRRRLVAAFGERLYLLLYSLLSLLLLVWLISAAVRAPTITLWPTGIWAYHLALALMLPACWLLVGGLTTPNPRSISLAGQRAQAKPGLPGLIRHPVLWGFALWAGVHAIANGDLVSLIMFGGFLLFSLGGMRLIDRRKRRQLGPQWGRLVQKRGWSGRQLLLTFGGGTLLYLLLLGLHPLLIGPNPLAVLL
jgi:uncharacterized membrane protein